MKSLRSLIPNSKFKPRWARNSSTIAPRIVERSWPEEQLDLSVQDSGGFYPGVIGDTLNSRYTIVRKLGWGQHSNVWLAKDELSKGTSQAYVAVKILTAHATQVQNSVADELGLLQHIRQTCEASRNPGKNYVLGLLDDFRLNSAHGSHICLVQPALGTFSKPDRGGFPVPVVKVFTRQLLLALDFLHNECHVIHTDLKHDNILVDLRDSDFDIQPQDVTLDDAKKVVDDSQAQVLSKPLRRYDPNDLLRLVDESSLHIRLSDFGTATTVEGYHAEIIQPPALRAPEVILGCKWGPPADIWNLGCLVFELLTGSWLFRPRGGPTWTPEAYHLVHMPAMAGEPFDPAVFQDGKNYDTYFRDDGQLRINVQGVVGLESAIQAYKVLTEEEAALCVSFLRSMLRLNPQERLDARLLAQHEWLKA